MLLIVTNKQDPHTDEVIRRLELRGASAFRLNTEDLLTKYRISLGVGGGSAWSGSITDQLGRSLCLPDLRVAWIRRPEYPFAHAADGVQRFVVAELRALVACLYALPSVTFVNEVFNADRAKTKFQQLLLASKMGIRVPRSLITNSPADLQAFAQVAKGDLLIKAVYTGNVERDGVKQGISSRKVSRSELLELSALARNAPTQIQDYIEKDYEIRVTVIGNQVFAVRIDSQLHEETKVDWRPYTTLNPHSICELPSHISDFCVKFVELQSLTYGAMDFIVDTSGNYVFLENNPSGQYLWLEQETGLPITDALVDMFLEKMRSPTGCA